MDNDQFWTDQQIHKEAFKEWTGLIASLWTANGKQIDDNQLRVYVRELRRIPMGLLEQSISRVLRENPYSNVPSIGAVWAALRKELSNPYDLFLAVDEWLERKKELFQVACRLKGEDE